MSDFQVVVRYSDGIQKFGPSDNFQPFEYQTCPVFRSPLKFYSIIFIQYSNREHFLVYL